VTASVKLDSAGALSGANATAGVLDVQGLKGQITGSLQVYAH